MKFRPVGVELFHADRRSEDGRTDMMKQIFRKHLQRHVFLIKDVYLFVYSSQSLQETESRFWAYYFGQWNQHSASGLSSTSGCIARSSFVS